VCVTVLGGAALGASTRAEAQPRVMPSAAHRARATQPDIDALNGWRWDQCIGGVTYGAPLRLAAAHGMGLRKERDDSGPDECWMLVAKVGFGGAQISAGWGASWSPYATGVAITANVVHTFGEPRGDADPRAMYVGASVHLWPLLALGGEIGVLRRVGAGATEARGRNVLTWSTGFGF
jgi:hypothetical protein